MFVFVNKEPIDTFHDKDFSTTRMKEESLNVSQHKHNRINVKTIEYYCSVIECTNINLSIKSCN